MIIDVPVGMDKPLQNMWKMKRNSFKENPAAHMLLAVEGVYFDSSLVFHYPPQCFQADKAISFLSVCSDALAKYTGIFFALQV